MKMQLLTVAFLPAFIHCQQPSQDSPSIFMPSAPAAGEDIINPYQQVRDIPLPGGFFRNNASPGSFEYWLRTIPLKKNNTVYLFNRQAKRNQQAQFAVLDISVGTQDLQQCADAVMRLKAEYLFLQRRVDEIAFIDNNRKIYSAAHVRNRKQFDQYLNQVFAYCGTASLEKQLLPVSNLKELKAGDVMIKGGYPGHAMMIVDVATNAAGKKIYLFAQSYMPAQDIHIVKNRTDDQLNPWYEIDENQDIVTPEWIFTSKNFKKWP
jgi:hypothetical protein